MTVHEEFFKHDERVHREPAQIHPSVRPSVHLIIRLLGAAGNINTPAFHLRTHCLLGYIRKALCVLCVCVNVIYSIHTTATVLGMSGIQSLIFHKLFSEILIAVDLGNL